MPTLKFQDGHETANLTSIKESLAGLGIELNAWAIPEAALPLTRKAALTDAEKSDLLALLDSRFLEQQSRYGYQSRDLIVLHPEVPDLDKLLTVFDKVHTHDDDEVRYIIDGEGKFGFLRNDGSQMLLTVQAGEYIRVPKNTRHWFVLTNSKRIKAVRYFTSKDGWAAKYTGDPVKF
jgi:1,2-dihydroxy-3-keto-5-methylthiopentene dioxygenase